MVLILSKESDITTNDVISWLDYYHVSWDRLNGEDLDSVSNSYSFEISSIGVLKQDYPIIFSDVKVVWFRRYHDFLRIKKELFKKSNNFNIESETISKLHFFLRNEVNKIYGYIINTLNCKWIDKAKNVELNKLSVLKIAQGIGLSIPRTLLTNDKNKIILFLNEFDAIVKPISDVLGVQLQEELYMFYTSTFSLDKLDDSSEIIFPSLLQEKIEKRYEIRTFYLFGECYSMAIFSQNDNQTKTDFRNYNHSKSNRMIPFNLPKEIKLKIEKLMEILELSHGSIDFIKGIDGIYYFLEVNPVGQFGMVSYPCNYYLEEKIAIKLKQFNDV